MKLEQIHRKEVSNKLKKVRWPISRVLSGGFPPVRSFI